MEKFRCTVHMLSKWRVVGKRVLVLPEFTEIARFMKPARDSHRCHGSAGRVLFEAEGHRLIRKRDHVQYLIIINDCTREMG
jgi:hypothetical protein